MENKSDYYQLDYIQYVNTSLADRSYFTTNYYPNDSSVISVDFEITEKRSMWRCIVGARTNSTNGLSVYRNPDKDNFGYFAGGKVQDNVYPFVDLDTPTHIECKYNQIKIGDDFVYDNGSTGYVYPQYEVPLLIFACQNDRSFVGKISNVNIKEGNNIVRDYVPALRKSDNKMCYYDRVNDEIITASNDSSFAIGNVVYDEIQPMSGGINNFHIGDALISDLYVGDSRVEAAYVGAYKVYQSTSTTSISMLDVYGAMLMSLPETDNNEVITLNGDYANGLTDEQIASATDKGYSIATA